MNATICSYCGMAEGHSKRCSVTKWSVPEERHSEIDWRAELARFRAALPGPPTPCPNPRECDSFACSQNMNIIRAYERVRYLLAMSTAPPARGERSPERDEIADFLERRGHLGEANAVRWWKGEKTK